MQRAGRSTVPVRPSQPGVVVSILMGLAALGVIVAVAFGAPLVSILVLGLLLLCPLLLWVPFRSERRSVEDSMSERADHGSDP